MSVILVIEGLRCVYEIEEKEKRNRERGKEMEFRAYTFVGWELPASLSDAKCRFWATTSVHLPYDDIPYESIKYRNDKTPTSPGRCLAR